MNMDSSYNTSQDSGSGWFSWLNPSTSSSTSTYVDPNKPKPWYQFWGGKRRKSRRLSGRRRKLSGRRRLIGGTALPNTEMNVASTASPIKGIYTAQPHNITRGGKKRKGKSRRKYRR